ncbi:stalk domain-containing protein [Paenibacillus humicola]|uniref:stalk domain-containing protein n=1 Tax=Paenibacillus humicola TaxID=3110540 RepID=UPI00237A4AB4|nr:stalk domain-containing protein [Paenibacillus humicola]
MMTNVKTLKKPLLAATAAAALLIGTAAPLGAHTADAAAKLQLKTMQISTEGRTLSVPAGMADGTTYVALSFLGKELGMSTAWDAKTRTVTVSEKNKTMTMKSGSEDFTINGHHINGIAPVILNGTTYLPLRFLLEKMGFTIGYDAKTKLISIVKAAENDIKLTNKTLEQKVGNTTVKVQYPQLSGTGGSSLGVINAALENEAKKYITDGVKTMKQASGDAPAATAAHLDYEVDYTITSNSKGKLSLYFNVYEYTGGAHGTYDYQAHTFDLKDGSELTLQQAAENNPNYISIINAEIKKQIAADKNLTLIAPFETIKPDQRFFLRGDSLVVYFSLYEYTPYVYGIPEFSIPLSLFKA